MPFTVADAASEVQGEVTGDPTVVLTGLAAAESARPGDLTFAEKESYFDAANQSPASAILVARDFAATGKVLIRVKDVRVAAARLLPHFHPPRAYPAGIHPTAVVAPSAKVHSDAHIGPHAVVEEGAEIGARSVLVAGNHLGAGSRIGADCLLFPGVVVYSGCLVGDRVRIHAGTVIGADGYGYVFDAGIHRKVLQVGKVVIGDDVEIGANACIDRAAYSATTIGNGTKIDNLVHIAHNVTIGRHCLIMGQVGFAGSTTVGDYAVVASQSGIAGHLTIGRQAVIGAKSGVMRDVPDQGVVLGIPAVADKQAKRQWVATQQLPDLIMRVRALERKLEQGR
ncbi:MAG TPA: UDP-3-O-(3-hydroxymyristoyl)glucosamine N-acyltransferase [Opitutaceae bacterium]|nr:UDP-3-O-(3-hydroxymyristoyl)glucosamine N-acyltransferase [Opitutaceae bacterium]